MSEGSRRHYSYPRRVGSGANLHGRVPGARFHWLKSGHEYTPCAVALVCGSECSMTAGFEIFLYNFRWVTGDSTYAKAVQ